MILQASQHVVIESHEHFTKQSYRNRCYIKGANKIQTLSIPVEKGNRFYRDIKIDYRQSWLKDHWRSITSAYGKSPFFEYYRDGFEEIYFKKEKFLFDLNKQLLTKCLDFLGITSELEMTDQYVKSPENDVIDLRSYIKPSQSHMDRDLYQEYPYQQIFGKGFVGNLSIIDLLCCEGPGAGLILKQSKAPSSKLYGF